VLADVGEDLTHLLEADAGVEQALDQLQLEQVPVRVAPPRPAARRVGQRRTDQVRAGPVVQLAVADADDLGRLLARETCCDVGHRASASSRSARRRSRWPAVPAAPGAGESV